MFFEGFFDTVSPRISSKIISGLLALVITLGGMKGYDVIAAKKLATGDVQENGENIPAAGTPEQGSTEGEKVFTDTDAAVLSGETLAESVLLYDVGKVHIIAKKEEIKVISCGDMSVLASAVLVSRAIDSGRVSESEYAVCPASAQKRPNYLPSSSILSVGKKMTVKDILKCMIYQKGSSFAYTLAVHISGSEEAFVSELNALAAELKLSGTAFTNVCGEDDGIAKTTAYDIGVLMKHFLADARLKAIFCSNEKLTVGAGETGGSVYLTVANDFFVSSCTEGQAKADGIVGGKVGTLGEKKWSIVLFSKGEGEYLSVTLGCVSPYSEALKIYALLL